MDHEGQFPRFSPNHQAVNPVPVPVAVERKSATLVPTVRHIPQQEVAVELVEAISGIKQSQAKTGLLLIAGEADTLSRPRVYPRGQHPFHSDARQGGHVAWQVTVVLLAKTPPTTFDREKGEA